MADTDWKTFTDGSILYDHELEANFSYVKQMASQSIMQGYLSGLRTANYQQSFGVNQMVGFGPIARTATNLTAGYGGYYSTTAAAYVYQTYNFEFPSTNNFVIQVDYEILTHIDTIAVNNSTDTSVAIEGYKRIRLLNSLPNLGGSTVTMSVYDGAGVYSSAFISNNEAGMSANEYGIVELTYDSNADFFWGVNFKTGINQNNTAYIYDIESQGIKIDCSGLAGTTRQMHLTSDAAVAASSIILGYDGAETTTATLEYSTNNGSDWIAFTNNTPINDSTTTSVAVKLSGTIAAGEAIFIRGIKILRLS